MYSFCTLFDSHYLSRGLAMRESLQKNCSDFHLYVFAFDANCYEYLFSQNLQNTTIISLSEFENDELLAVKQGRTKAEYCWTCTPSIIKYCIEKYNLESCTYVDADVYFFSDPSVLIEEIGNASVLITEHRYTLRYDQTDASGIYCVQFMTFKNNPDGLVALNWWRNACLDWCFARVEDGKMGDQKYLDDWTTRFKGVHVLQHLGGGLAPWNIQQYEIKDADALSFQEKKSGINFSAVFYHFHHLKFLDELKVYLGDYELSKQVLRSIYLPYILKVLSIEKHLRGSSFAVINAGFTSRKNITPDWKWFIKKLLNKTGNFRLISDL